MNKLTANFTSLLAGVHIISQRNLLEGELLRQNYDDDLQ